MELQPSSSSVEAVDMDQFVRELRTTEHGPYITLESVSMELFSTLGHTPDYPGAFLIDSLPVVQVSDPGMECPICSVEFEVGSSTTVIKEMPCKHRFCKGCLAKSLRLKRSCPVCNYNVPRVYWTPDTSAMPSCPEEQRLLVVLMVCFMFLLSFFYSWAKLSFTTALNRYGF